MTQFRALPRCADLGRGCPPALRLGLATRGNTHLEAADVAYSVRRGVNYLNWCGYDDGLARALRERLVGREQVVVAMQLEGPGRPPPRQASCSGPPGGGPVSSWLIPRGRRCPWRPKTARSLRKT